MSKPAVLWGASVGAVLGYAVAVLAPFAPSLYFFPRLGVWGFSNVPSEPVIQWYGWLIYAALGGLVGMAAGRLLKRHPPWAVVWVLSAASLLLLTWHERQWFLK